MPTTASAPAALRWLERPDQGHGLHDPPWFRWTLALAGRGGMSSQAARLSPPADGAAGCDMTYSPITTHAYICKHLLSREDMDYGNMQRIDASYANL
jgi:hypothetical protein